MMLRATLIASLNGTECCEAFVTSYLWPRVRQDSGATVQGHPNNPEGTGSTNGPGHERALRGRTGYFLRSSGVICRITSDPFSIFLRISASFCCRRSRCCCWMDVIVAR